MTTGSSSDDDPEFIERLEAGEPPRTREEAEARAPYEQLLRRIHGLGDVAPPADWEDRAFARWSSARRKRRLGIGVGAAVVVVAAAMLLLQLRTDRAAPRLELAVLSVHGSIRRGDVAVGDRLKARIDAAQAHVELRVYRGTVLLARCPGGTLCRRDATVIELEWTLAEPGAYQIVGLSSSSSIPAGDGTIDRDLLDARAAGANIAMQRLPVVP